VIDDILPIAADRRHVQRVDDLADRTGVRAAEIIDRALSIGLDAVERDVEVQEFAAKVRAELHAAIDAIPPATFQEHTFTAENALCALRNLA